MAGSLKRVLLWGLAAALLLCGCHGTSQQDGGEQEYNTAHSGGSLSVCAGERYRFALQQILSHINLSGNGLTLTWTDDMEEADVVITDNIEPQELAEFQVIQTDKLDLQGIEALAAADERGIVGLPLFLRVDGFWYDELLYSQYSATAPQSMNSWQESAVAQQYPAVCDEGDMDAVFWGVIAPLYLSAGGTEAELSTGSLQQAYLLPALEQLETLLSSGLLQLSTDARQAFTAVQTAYWLTGVDRVAESYNYMSNLSSWWPSLSLLFPADQQAVCVVRAEVLAVRSTVEPELAERFLKVFFDQQTAADLSSYVRMPMASQMRYSPDTVPELPQICYTALSSPMVDIAYAACTWEQTQITQVCDTLLELMNGQIDAAQAASTMLQ